MRTSTESQASEEMVSSKQQMPPTLSSVDAEVDIEVLKAVPQQFCVADESSANWVIRRIVSARQYSERVRDWAEREQQRAAREERTLMFLFGAQLERWAREEIAARFRGRKKSLALPAGLVGYRSVAAKFVIDDEQAILAWAREHCEHAIIVVEKLIKSEIDAYITRTGAVPDSGLHVESAQERFYLR